MLPHIMFLRACLFSGNLEGKDVAGILNELSAVFGNTSSNGFAVSDPFNSKLGNDISQTRIVSFKVFGRLCRIGSFSSKFNEKHIICIVSKLD